MPGRQDRQGRSAVPCHDDHRQGRVVVTGAGGTMGRAVVHGLIDDGCRVALIDLHEASMAPLVDEYGAAVCAVACDISERDAVQRRARARGRRARAGRRARQQRRHPVEPQARRDQPRRMAPRDGGEPRRRAVLVAGGGAVDEGAALRPHHQRQLARREDRRADRGHRLFGVQGRAQRADVLARARTRAARRHRQRHRTGVRAHADGHRAVERRATRTSCCARFRSGASASPTSSRTRCAFSRRRWRASSPARYST